MFDTLCALIAGSAVALLGVRFAAPQLIRALRVSFASLQRHHHMLSANEGKPPSRVAWEAVNRTILRDSGVWGGIEEVGHRLDRLRELVEIGRRGAHGREVSLEQRRGQRAECARELGDIVVALVADERLEPPPRNVVTAEVLAATLLQSVHGDGDTPGCPATTPRQVELLVARHGMSGEQIVECMQALAWLLWVSRPRPRESEDPRGESDPDPARSAT